MKTKYSKSFSENSTVGARQAAPLRAALIVCAAFIGLLFFQTAFSASEVDRIVEGAQKRYEKIKTCQMNFHQTLTSSAFKKVIREADGIIYYVKPGKIRWEYKTPEERTYLIDGEMFWDYDPKAKQVMKVPLGDALAGDAPRGFLFGAGNLRKDFNVSLAGGATSDPKVGYRLALNPKDPDLRNAVSNLVLNINPTDFSVTGSSFTDTQGNINEYKFSNIVVNPQLAPDLFIFKMPRGVKVILPITKSEMRQHK